MKLSHFGAGVLIALACASIPCLAQSATGNPLTPLCAPYALYPDTLLAQVLAASTYPDQVMAAEVWCNSNPGVQGDALAAAMAQQTWDPSVKALCTFPDVLKKMTDDMSNTTTLGQDFVSNKSAVMDCVQAIRAQAQTMGALTSTPQQTVQSSGGNIIIQPANPNTIYVPTYDPDAFDDDDGDYPYGAGLLGFGTGVALGAAYTDNYGAFNWADHGMYCGTGVYTGAAYHQGVYGNTYAGATAWSHNYGYGQAGAVHTGTTGVYTGPMGNTSVYHSGTTAAGYRGYDGAGAGAYSHTSGFATTAGGGFAAHESYGGYASREACRGYGSMGGDFGHFGGGGFRGGFRR